MAIGRNTPHAAVAGCVLVCAALTIVPLCATLFAMSDDDESSITLGASLVKPYQYSGDAREFTVDHARGSDAAPQAPAAPAETGPETKAEGDNGARRP